MARAVAAIRRQVRIRPVSRAYDILIGSGHLERLPKEIRGLGLGNSCALVSNSMVLRRHGARIVSLLKRGGFSVEVFPVGNSERSKSWTAAGRLIGQLADRNTPGKKMFLLLAGGGVVGDLGGLVAGLYRRGIPYVQLPTTLLAQVDSSIGGKTGVDLAHGKNLVGIFNQPSLVFIELRFLETLSDRQFRSGLAEVIKCAVIQDTALFSFLEKSSVEGLRADPRALQWVIGRAAGVKAELVSRDERETRGLRTLLNFGHTFGHALESAVGYRGTITHGEAVALGMHVATDLSRRLGLLKDSERIHRILDRFGLPRATRSVPLRAIRKAMAHDKKWARGRNRWVLPTAVGRAVVREGISEALIARSIRTVLEG